MNTDQKYAGKGNYANPIKETTENANQTAQRPFSHFEESEVINDFDKLAINFYDSVESEGTISSLCRVLEHWITTEYKTLAAHDGMGNDGACSEDMAIWDTVIGNVFATINLASEVQNRANSYYYKRVRARESELETICRAQSELIEGYEEQIALRKQVDHSQDELIEALKTNINLPDANEAKS